MFSPLFFKDIKHFKGYIVYSKKTKSKCYRVRSKPLNSLNALNLPAPVSGFGIFDGLNNLRRYLKFAIFIAHW